MNRVTLLFVAIVLLLLPVACRSQPGDRPPSPTPTNTSALSPTGSPTLSPTSVAQPATATPTPPPPDIINTLESMSEFSTLLNALGTAELVEKLHSDGPFTLFAPTDVAFAELPPDLLADNDMLLELLLYHVVAGMASPQQLAVADTVVPLLGDDAPLMLARTESGTVSIDGVALPATPIQVDNGLIYMLDAVLIPPSAQAWMRSRTVQSTVPGQNVELPGLLELADGRPELSTLRDGWEAAGLEESLAGEGPFTIFAPTDTAFTTLVENVSDELLFQLDTDPAPYLRYMIVPLYVPAAALQEGLVLETEQGETITVYGTPGATATDGSSAPVQLRSSTGLTATITTADLPARNGILHVVDGVLLPELQASQPITP